MDNTSRKAFNIYTNQAVPKYNLSPGKLQTDLSEQEIELFQQLKEQYNNTIQQLFAIFDYRDKLDDPKRKVEVITKSPITRQLQARSPNRNTKKFKDLMPDAQMGLTVKFKDEIMQNKLKLGKLMRAVR